MYREVIHEFFINELLQSEAVVEYAGQSLHSLQRADCQRG
jgi:hypothetical protein